jgi:hypothetical protein
MTLRNVSTATFGRILAVIAGLVFLAGCGGGSSSGGSSSGSPAVSLSATSLTFTSQGVGTASAAQTVTVTNTGTATLVFSSVTVSGTNSGDFVPTTACSALAAGANCTISVTFTPAASGTGFSGTLNIADNAGNSPQTVALSGSIVVPLVSFSPSALAFGSQFQGTNTSLPVTLTNNGTVPLAISSITASAPFSETNTCGSSVNPGGSCTINVAFSPTALGTSTGALTVSDNASGSPQTVGLTGTGYSNSAAVSVNFGPNGNTGDPLTNYPNGIFTTVTVCEPGSTTNCSAIPNVLVDTGSFGLRVLSTYVSSLTLPQVSDPLTGDPIYECVQYGDLSYTWGPMQMATVQIGGETALQVPPASGGTANSGIPIQVISAGVTPPSQVGLYGSNTVYDNPCLTIPGSNPPTFSDGLNDDNVANLGAYGILGVGNLPQDCGVDCTSITNTTGQYLICDSVGSSTCDIQAVSLQDQAWNPVATFASADTNGVVLQLPAITGSPDVGASTVNGTLVFGIGTQTCPGSPTGCTPNGLGSAQVYALDQSASFPSIQFLGVPYSDSNGWSYSYLDSGSNSLFISDSTTLNSYATATYGIGVSDYVYDGTDTGFYNTTATLSIPNIVFTDINGVNSPAISVSIANAEDLFSTGNAAFDNLAAESCGEGCESPQEDSFGFGLPFYFGRNVYFGIEGTTPPNGASAPYGYVAF